MWCGRHRSMNDWLHQDSSRFCMAGQADIKAWVWNGEFSHYFIDLIVSTEVWKQSLQHYAKEIMIRETGDLRDWEEGWYVHGRKKEGWTGGRRQGQTGSDSSLCPFYWGCLFPKECQRLWVKLCCNFKISFSPITSFHEANKPEVTLIISILGFFSLLEVHYVAPHILLFHKLFLFKGPIAVIEVLKDAWLHPLSKDTCLFFL